MFKRESPIRGFLKTLNFSLYRNYANNRSERQADLFNVTVVLYDRACPICRAEMQRLKRHDKYARLVLIDIDSPAFNERTWGVTREQASQALHVLTPDDTWLIGMAAIRHVYERVGLGWLLVITRWPLISTLADTAYRYIAPNRYAISRWLGLGSESSRCADAACNVNEYKRGGAHD